jgi:hypothetical protein
MSRAPTVERIPVNEDVIRTILSQGPVLQWSKRGIELPGEAPRLPDGVGTTESCNFKKIFALAKAHKKEYRGERRSPPLKHLVIDESGQVIYVIDNSQSRGYFIIRSDSFVYFDQEGVRHKDAKTNGRKVHVSIDPKQLKQGSDIVKDILMRRGAPTFKFVKPHVSMDGEQRGKQVTIYTEHAPHLDWSAIFTEINRALEEKRIRPDPSGRPPIDMHLTGRYLSARLEEKGPSGEIMAADRAWQEICKKVLAESPSGVEMIFDVDARMAIYVEVYSRLQERLRVAASGDKSNLARFLRGNTAWHSGDPLPEHMRQAEVLKLQDDWFKNAGGKFAPVVSGRETPPQSSCCLCFWRMRPRPTVAPAAAAAYASKEAAAKTSPAAGGGGK